MHSNSSLITKALGVLITGLLSLSFPAHAGQQMEKSELISALKKGGYVIYLRHAATNTNTADTKRDDLNDWTKQRNLSELGRYQSVAIGQAFDALGIPVSEVITSPYCRCVETAKLAFGRARVSNDLAFSIGTKEQEAKRLAQALRNMLGTRPTARTNTVLVAHTANLKEAAQIWPKPEGVAFIFKPLGNNTFEMVSRIEPQQWPELAEKMGVPIAPNQQMSPLPDRGLLCGRQDASIH